jgi:hypothetical protein
MSTHRLLRLSFASALLAVSAGLTTQVGALAGSQSSVSLPFTAATPDCVVRLDPVQPGETSSHVSVVGCFKTFAEAAAAGTNGGVQLPPMASAKKFTQAKLNAQLNLRGRGLFHAMDCTPNCTGTIIGIDYWDIGFSGSILMYTTNNSAGCTAGANYYWTSLPYPWDNKVSSARSYTGCQYFHHWVDTGFTGGQLIVQWSNSNFGSVMNDTTSSVGLKQSS